MTKKIKTNVKYPKRVYVHSMDSDDLETKLEEVAPALGDIVLVYELKEVLKVSVVNE